MKKSKLMPSYTAKGMMSIFALLLMLFILSFPVSAITGSVPYEDESDESTFVDKIVEVHRDYRDKMILGANAISNESIKDRIMKILSDDSFENYLTAEQRKEHDAWEQFRKADEERIAKAKEEYRIRQEEAAKQAKALEEKRAKTRANITSDSDLSNREIELSEAEMNSIISHWEEYNGGSPFHGNGRLFIEASKASGLDPIYILAHASWESDWGRSWIARNKGNYFGINAVDTNPAGAAHHMGSTMEAGLVNGAKWISDNYYKEGQTTLNSMIYGHKMYATAADGWIYGIQSIMRESYSYLHSIR